MLHEAMLMCVGSGSRVTSVSGLAISETAAGPQLKRVRYMDLGRASDEFDRT